MIVHFEEQARDTFGAGFQLGIVQNYLEGFIHTCTNWGKDIS